MLVAFIDACRGRDLKEVHAMNKGQYIILPVLVLIASESFADPFVDHVIYRGRSESDLWEFRHIANEQFSYRVLGQRQQLGVIDEDQYVTHSGNFQNDLLMLFVDWHPFQGNLRLSTGIVVNDHALGFTSSPTIDEFSPKYRITPEKMAEYGITGVSESIVIDPVPIKINEEHINIRSDVYFDSVGSYIGLGWGNKLDSPAKLRFSVDIGYMLYGGPSFDSDLHGEWLQIDPRVTQWIHQEFDAKQHELQQELSDFRKLPHVSMIISRSW